MSRQVTIFVDEREKQRQRRMALLLARLPERVANAIHWLLRPERRWARIPVGVLMMIGGLLWFLPVLGLWMLPVGFLLLAEDVSLFRRWSSVLLEWMERRHPGWLGLVH